SDSGALLRANAPGDRQGSTPSSAYVEGDDLPEGWTECRSLNGRLYYMNHVNRTTQWDRPTQPAALVAASGTPSRPVSSRSSGQHSSRHHHGNRSHQAQSSIDSTTSVASANSAPPS